jgi:hypothetical protein
MRPQSLLIALLLLTHCYAQDSTSLQLKPVIDNIYSSLSKNNIYKLQVENFTDENQSQNKLTAYLLDLTNELLYDNSNGSNGKLLILNNPNKKNQPEGFLSAKVMYFPKKYKITFKLTDKDGNLIYTQIGTIDRTNELKSQEGNTNTQTAEVNKSSTENKNDTPSTKTVSIISSIEKQKTVTANPVSSDCSDGKGDICLKNNGNQSLDLEIHLVTSGAWYNSKSIQTLTLESGENGCFFDLNPGTYIIAYKPTQFMWNYDSYKTKTAKADKCVKKPTPITVKIDKEDFKF